MKVSISVVLTGSEDRNVCSPLGNPDLESGGYKNQHRKPSIVVATRINIEKFQGNEIWVTP